MQGIVLICRKSYLRLVRVIDGNQLQCPVGIVNSTCPNDWSSIYICPRNEYLTMPRLRMNSIFLSATVSNCWSTTLRAYSELETVASCSALEVVLCASVSDGLPASGFAESDCRDAGGVEGAIWGDSLVELVLLLLPPAPYTRPFGIFKGLVDASTSVVEEDSWDWCINVVEEDAWWWCEGTVEVGRPKRRLGMRCWSNLCFASLRGGRKRGCARALFFAI